MEKVRRRFQRIPFDVPAQLSVAGVIYHADTISNLSIGGCLFPFPPDLRLKEESTCRLAIQLNKKISKPQVLVTGEVIYSDQGMAGIKFTQIEPESLFHLQNIIRYNAPDPEQIEHEIQDHPGLV